MLLDDIEYELSILEIEQQIDLKVNKKLEESQKEFYLKEKLNLHDNSCDDKICDLINGVIEELNNKSKLGESIW